MRFQVRRTPSPPVVIASLPVGWTAKVSTEKPLWGLSQCFSICQLPQRIIARDPSLLPVITWEASGVKDIQFTVSEKLKVCLLDGIQVLSFF